MHIKTPTGQSLDVVIKDCQKIHKDLIFELAQVVNAPDSTSIGDFIAYGRTGKSVCIWIAGSGSEAEVTGFYRERIRRYSKTAVGR